MKRRLALRSSLASDLERLTSLLVQVCTRRRRARDFTRVELREALRETIVHVPAYRSYVTVRGDEVERTLADMNYVDLAIARAREARQDLDGELFDLLRSVLLAELDLPEALDLALRTQQLTGSGCREGRRGRRSLHLGSSAQRQRGRQRSGPAVDVSRRLSCLGGSARRLVA